MYWSLIFGACLPGPRAPLVCERGGVAFVPTVFDEKDRGFSANTLFPSNVSAHFAHAHFAVGIALKSDIVSCLVRFSNLAIHPLDGHELTVYCLTCPGNFRVVGLGRKLPDLIRFPNCPHCAYPESISTLLSLSIPEPQTMSGDSDRETKPFKFVTAGMCRSGTQLWIWTTG